VSHLLGKTVTLCHHPEGYYVAKYHGSKFLDPLTKWSGIISAEPSRLTCIPDCIDIVLQDGDEVAIMSSWIQ
jgi:hypothetical protein